MRARHAKHCTDAATKASEARNQILKACVLRSGKNRILECWPSVVVNQIGLELIQLSLVAPIALHRLQAKANQEKCVVLYFLASRKVGLQEWHSPAPRNSEPNLLLQVFQWSRLT